MSTNPIEYVGNAVDVSGDPMIEMIGPAFVVPTGARGRGIREIVMSEDKTMTAVFTDGATQALLKFDLTLDPAALDSIPLSSTVIQALAASELKQVDRTTQVIAGTGLLGGGELQGDVTLAANFGAAAGTITEGNDPRLSDARTPVAHQHPQADVTGLVSKLAALDSTDSGLRTDVDGKITKPATATNGQVLTYSASGWIAAASSAYTKAEVNAAFAPISHTHPIADVTGLQAALNAKYTTPTSGTTGHVLAWNGSGLALTAPPAADLTNYYTKAQANATFAPVSHTHSITNVTGLQAALDAKLTTPTSGTTGHVLTWNGSALTLAAASSVDLTNYYTKAEANAAFAAASHTHTVANVTGLQAALDAKLTTPTSGTTGHVLTWNGSALTLQAASAAVDLTNYYTKAEANAAFAAASHTHTVANVTGLQAALDEKLTTPTTGTTGHVLTWNGSALTLAAASGSVDLTNYYTKAEVNAAFAPLAHTHTVADTTGLQAALDAKLTTPTSGTTGHVLTWNGSAVELAAPPEGGGGGGGGFAAETFTFTKSGAQGLYSSAQKVYNDAGATRTIVKLRASVLTAPTGSGLTVKLMNELTEVGTVTIAAGSLTNLATLNYTTWTNGTWLSVHVTAVGSTTPGSDLTVQVVA